MVPDFAPADFLIKVRGSSMYPKYAAGDIIACKRIQMDTFIQWNKTHVLDTSQGVLLKRILKGDTPDKWILRSDNKDFLDIEITPSSDVYSISIIIGLIRLI
jgi:repressor LexA